MESTYSPRGPLATSHSTYGKEKRSYSPETPPNTPELALGLLRLPTSCFRREQHEVAGLPRGLV